MNEQDDDVGRGGSAVGFALLWTLTVLVVAICMLSLNLLTSIDRWYLALGGVMR
jgi:hypothetical protein